MTDAPYFSAVVLSLFPEMFPGTLGYSLAGKALENGLWSLQTLNIRDFATDKHRTVDDTPYGGGVGMVMKPDVLSAALDHARSLLPNASIIYPSPRGKVMHQSMAQSLASTPSSLIILCGRFEGIDQRVIDHYSMLEVSLGDFVLSGGEIAAMALLDATIRLLPGVIGNDQATKNDSFSAHSSLFEQMATKKQPIFTENTKDFAGLLEYPHYTRPPDWNGRKVPDVLLSGDHQKIQQWRLEQAKDITLARRPELLDKLKGK